MEPVKLRDKGKSETKYVQGKRFGRKTDMY
jgi:hypothetical protein